MFARNTDRVSRWATVLSAVVVAGLVGAVVWYVALREGDPSDASDAPGAGQELVSDDRASVPLDGAPSANATDASAPGAASGSSAGAASGAVDGGNDTTIALADGAVLVSYPDGFGLAVTPEQVQVASQIPPCDQGFDYCLYLDTDEFAGTNFSAAGVRIDERDDLTTEADCMLAQPGGFVGLVPVIAGASDFATTMYQDVGEGAAGHVSTGSLGRLYYGSACYEFETRVAHAQFGNFPRGAVEEFDASDVESTEDRLMSVLDEVTLPDGRTGLWARKVPTEPTHSSPAAARDTQGGADAVVSEQAAAAVAIAEPVAGAEVMDGDGAVLASGVGMADGDWSTEALVPFEASIEFDVTSPTDAVLVLAKDNPSGLPENDASFEIPLHLLP